jgi:hypothetical protein
MAIFNSYACLPEGKGKQERPWIRSLGGEIPSGIPLRT